MQVNEVLTARFIEAFDKGEIPWQKPWHSTGPKNAMSKKAYRGINFLLLSFYGNGDYFLTFNQGKKMGGTLKKGSKGLPVAFYKMLEKKDSAGTVEKRVPLLRYSTVFNVNDFEGLKFSAPETLLTNFVPLEVCEQIAQKNLTPIKHIGNRACFIPSLQEINMPARETFKSVEAYYCTLFHEIGHSLYKASGDVLDTNFGADEYSKEELVAELFAAFCVHHCGIYSESLFTNSVAYLQSWKKRFKDDASLIISAASKAQKRFDALLGIVPEPFEEKKDDKEND